jgi:hypothetical protein
MKLAILISGAIAIALPQLAMARTPQHTSASGLAPFETIDGHKIPGAPNGMLTELIQSVSTRTRV